MDENVLGWMKERFGDKAEQMIRRMEKCDADESARLRLGEASAVRAHRNARALLDNMNRNGLSQKAEDFSRRWCAEMMGNRVLDPKHLRQFCQKTQNFMRDIVDRRKNIVAEREEFDRQYPPHLTRQMWFKFDIPYGEL